MNVPRNIAFVVSQLAWVGGTGAVTCSLANALVNEDQHVLIISLEKDSNQVPAFPLDPRIKVVGLNTRRTRLRGRILENFWKISRVLKQYRIDQCILVGNYQGLIAAPAVAISRLHPFRHTRFLFHDHGALMNQWDNYPVRFMRWLSTLLCQDVITLTESSRHAYIEKFRASANHVTAIPNWIDPSIINSRKPYSMKSKKILWAGRMTDEKGSQRIVPICEKALVGFPDWTVEVAGDGPGFAALYQDVSCSPIGHQIKLLGTVPNISSHLSKYACVILTSDREGMPMILLEAKGAGIPMVSFDVSTGPSSIIQDGADGVLVPPYSIDDFAAALVKLMASPKLRRSMANVARKDSERFSKHEIMKKWLKLLNLEEPH